MVGDAVKPTMMMMMIIIIETRYLSVRTSVAFIERSRVKLIKRSLRVLKWHDDPSADIKVICVRSQEPLITV